MRREKRRRSTGFTLIELIVVITIIGILGTVVVVKFGGFTEKARITKIKYDLQNIYKAAELYKVTSGSFPQSIDELVNPPQNAGGGAQQIDEPLLEKAPKDPWNNEYTYELDSNGKPRIRCLGKDGADGGELDNQDYSWPDEAGT